MIYVYIAVAIVFAGAGVYFMIQNRGLERKRAMLLENNEFQLLVQQHLHNIKNGVYNNAPHLHQVMQEKFKKFPAWHFDLLKKDLETVLGAQAIYADPWVGGAEAKLREAMMIAGDAGGD